MIQHYDDVLDLVHELCSDISALEATPIGAPPLVTPHTSLHVDAPMQGVVLVSL